MNVMRKTQFPYRTIGCARYTFDAWMKCYPKSNYDEWYKANRPDSIIEFYYGFLDKLNVNTANFNLKVVTIDDEYFGWLGDRNNTEDEINKYVETMKGTEATRLLKANKMDRLCGAYFIPVVYVSNGDKIATVSISNKLRNQIRKGVEKATDSKVFVSNHVLSSMTLSCFSQDDYLCLYEKMMQRDDDFIKGIATRVTGKPGVPNVDFIPILVDYRVKTSLIRPLDYITPGSKEFLIPSSNWCSILDKETVEETENGVVIVNPYVVDLEELPEVFSNIMNDINASIEKEATEDYVDAYA